MMAAHPQEFYGIPAPADFEERFVLQGRLHCEDHYQGGRNQVAAWMRQLGKQRLLEARSTYVREVVRKEAMRPCPPDFDLAFVNLGRNECERRYSASNRLVDRWLRERGKDRLLEAREAHLGRLNRVDVGRMLSKAFPLQPSDRHPKPK